LSIAEYQNAKSGDQFQWSSGPKAIIMVRLKKCRVHGKEEVGEI